MKIEETIDLLWQATQQGVPPPAALQKTLSFADAYRVQLGILARWQAKGEKIGGWKIGLSADAALTPYPTSLDLGQVTAEMRRNGEVMAQVRGQEVIDNQLDSIAWLANHLAEYGMALEEGQRIMSGSFTKPAPIAKGDRWETRFSPVGMVSAAFV